MPLGVRDMQNALREGDLERGYRWLRIDMTIARPTPTALGVNGHSLGIVNYPPGVSFQLRFNAPTNDPIPSADLTPGMSFSGFEFTEVYLENEAAAAGSAPLVLWVGRR